jgi:hypothetical protein
MVFGGRMCALLESFDPPVHVGLNFNEAAEVAGGRDVD